jgi:hypothetical protein
MMRARTQTVELVEAGHIETSHFDDASKHPYRAWIWLGVFVVGAAFWVGVGLGIHALVQ